MNRFEDMVNFVAVIDAGGISAAADRLNLSKSVVSRRLKILEERLAIQLVVRTTRTQRVTDEGQVFYERCKQILADLEEAETTLTHEAVVLTGSLRITAPVHLGQKFIAPAITEFISLHKNLVVDLDLADRHMSLVDEGFDLAIRIGRLPDSSLIARQLAPVEIFVCASPDYIATHGEPATIEELSRRGGLLHRAGTNITGWSWIDTDGAIHHVRTVQRMVSNNDDVLLTAARQGFGIISMPDFAVTPDIAAGRLRRIMTEINWSSMHAYAVYPPTRHLSNRVRAFVDFLVARYGKSIT